MAASLTEDAARAGVALEAPALEAARASLALGSGMVLERWAMGEAFDPGLAERASAALRRGMERSPSPSRSRSRPSKRSEP